MRVAYGGASGAYAERAARAAFPGCAPAAQASVEASLAAVAQWSSDRALVPIENTISGVAHGNLDLLVSQDLHVVGEVSMELDLALLALPDTREADIERVLSSAAVLDQCGEMLRGLGGAPAREVVADAGLAAREVARQGAGGSMACVAGRACAEEYGLKVLAEGVQDPGRGRSVTRYLALAREPWDGAAGGAAGLGPGGVASGAGGAPEDRDVKTSIVFALKDGPGQLYKALAAFSLRDLNLTKIESRPMKAIVDSTDMDPVISSGQFNYLFYIDFVGHAKENRAQQALRHLQEGAPFLKILGSYPVNV